VTNVQQEMSRMHAELVNVLDTEHKQHLSGRELFAQLKREYDATRVENAELMVANGGLKAAMSNAQADMAALRVEVERYVGMCQQLRAENAGLMESLRGEHGQKPQLKQQWGGVVAIEEEGRRATKEYMDDRLERMRQDFAKQLEAQMTAVMREVQDQKTAREQAERMVNDMRQVRQPRALNFVPNTNTISSDLET